MKKLFIPCIAVVAILMSSCKKDEETKDKSNVSLAFNHKVGAEVLLFDTINYSNAAGHKYEVTKLEYFVSNITFHATNGSEYTLDGPIYVNAAEANTLTHSGIEIPQGEYTHVSLTMGLDTVMNKSNTLTSAEAISMAWPEMMGGGYHYMKFEGRYDSLETNTIKNFALHTGASMGMPYHFSVDLEDTRFALGSDDLTVNFTMDLNEWFTGNEIYDFVDYGHMIMALPDAQAHLQENGVTVFSASITK